ncbi:MAG: M50 family metallopeptidase [Candidatus Nomurabacteria bacterium]|nr:M50 family metallopeptidase [Candidatus Nomurabacteria bacterium]
MPEITIGILIIVISLLSYFSNWINWRFLNYKINYFLYYLGTFIHETSHAIACLLTGSKISQYKILVQQPRVVYSNPRLPLIGNLLISIAPMFGGLLFLFLVNKYFLANQFIMPSFIDWKLFLNDFWNLLKQIDITQWQNWIVIFLFLNIGATIGSSWQDLKNVWFIILFLVFIPWPFFTHLGLLAIALILINIIFQVILTVIISVIKYSINRFSIHIFIALL